MLTLPEKILFALAVLGALVAASQTFLRLRAIIRRGKGEIRLDDLPARAWKAALNFLSQRTVLRHRPLASLWHALVAWGFTFYLLVNLGDVLAGYLPGFHFFGRGLPGGIYRLLADVLSVGVLVGMVALLARRFLRKDPALTTRDSTLLHPKARAGIRRDSLIVGAFILLHVGARFVGQSFALAGESADAWQPFASALAGLWRGWNASTLTLLEHLSWWLALGLILAFVPYFEYSKHLHIFFAPLNFFLKPQRKPGALDPVNFDDDSITQFGANKLEDLPWTALVDAYSCIMCNRCQEVCPAYTTGKALSPAALEINKRYFLKEEGGKLAAGAASGPALLEWAITPEAVWACTACGACNDICPVGNEPMRDILEIRRSLVLTDNQFPEPFQTAFRGMERAMNPWNLGPDKRLLWAEGLDVPLADDSPDFEILWWVGCAPATDARAQKTARDLAKLLHAAGVRFAVLGEREACTGDSARRAGNEFLFSELAKMNVETLNEAIGEQPRRILTTCPHCLHTLLNEYGAFGGHYQVVHHTEYLNELIAAGRLKVNPAQMGEVTFHDPCYLGRHNGIVAAPRQALASAGIQITEMPRTGLKSFCCGAGGAQIYIVKSGKFEQVAGFGMNP